MRGGTANCNVISDEPVGSPILNTATTLIVMNGPSLDKFEKAVVPGGMIITDSSLVGRILPELMWIYVRYQRQCLHRIWVILHLLILYCWENSLKTGMVSKGKFCRGIAKYTSEKKTLFDT